MTNSFEQRLVAHFNRPRPSIQTVSGISNEEWNLNEPMADRAQQIVSAFVSGGQPTTPCPVAFGTEWFQRLCALGEWIALLEAKLDPAEFSEDEEVEEDDE